MNYDIFENKNVLVFMPHEDDEINTVYGLLYNIKNIASSIKVVYSTNGNYIVKDKYRQKEGIKSLNVIGIKEEDIIFMGYSDQIPEGCTHLYHENKLWKDKFGNYKTKSYYKKEYHYEKYNEHGVFNKENFIKDIEEIIIDNKPDIIFCIDFDSHPDHRALSLSFEISLGRVLNTNLNYHPKVFKSFAYPTSYKTISDYNINNPETKFIKEENSLSELQNPYYDWRERIIFKNTLFASNYLYLKNIYFWGLLKHKSQYILNRINEIINSDLVFFERNTYNLLNDTKNITVSSGNASYLNDFLLFDVDNILGGTEKVPVVNNNFTIIKKDDKDKKIEITFNSSKNIDIIKIYVKPNCTIDNIKISYNNKNIKINWELKNNIYIIRNLNIKNTNNLKIEFKNKKDIFIGELEILESENITTYAYLSINDSIYNKYYVKDKYELNIKSNDKNINKYKIIKNNNKVYLMYNDNVIDKLILKKKYKILINIETIINKITLFIGRVYQKLVKEIRKCTNWFDN